MNIKKELKIPLPPAKSFRCFLHELSEWWPKEYTWSQEDLQEIKMETQVGGLCIELGPFGFRCDWGRVVELQEDKLIAFKWQISPKRIPEPNPDRASLVTVKFFGKNNDTLLEFEHSQFENHGDGADAYLQAMNSEQGWDYILEKFRKYCETR